MGRRTGRRHPSRSASQRTLSGSFLGGTSLQPPSLPQSLSLELSPTPGHPPPLLRPASSRNAVTCSPPRAAFPDACLLLRPPRGDCLRCASERRARATRHTTNLPWRVAMYSAAVAPSLACGGHARFLRRRAPGTLHRSCVSSFWILTLLQLPHAIRIRLHRCLLSRFSTACDTAFASTSLATPAQTLAGKHNKCSFICSPTTGRLSDSSN